jgi:hypothetical protein
LLLGTVGHHEDRDAPRVLVPPVVRPPRKCHAR